MSLKDFCNVTGCKYDKAYRAFNDVIASNKKNKKHFTYKGRKIIFDDVIENQLMEKLGYVLDPVAEEVIADEYGENIADPETADDGNYADEEAVHPDNSSIDKYREVIRILSINNAVYQALGREYRSGDEDRLFDYLVGCDDFRRYMNVSDEEREG